VESFKQLKAQNAFEVRRPKTTKEIALHNNQLLQQLLMKLDQMAHPAAIAADMAGWSQAMHEQPQAPRMSPQEMDEVAAKQIQELLHRVEELEERNAGVMFTASSCSLNCCLWLCLLVQFMVSDLTMANFPVGAEFTLSLDCWGCSKTLSTLQPCSNFGSQI
jgi:hypothetical protein